MKLKRLLDLTFLVLLAVVLTAGCSTDSGKERQTLSVPFEYHKLDNGLKVVLSPDRTAPLVATAVYYKIGFRVEPKGRTGFAHLFEHMMFQGSANLGKMEFIKLVQANGGILNGSTRFDFTNYYEIVPAHKLETMLWAEADRMKGLAINDVNLENQKGVVSNEVKVNVLNRPYGGFPWLDMPQIANENWYNSHNFYGDLADLQAATLEDVQEFFNIYYSPNNAVLVISGDFEPVPALELVKKYFGSIPAAELPPEPDLKEPEQTEAKRQNKVDNLADRPALAFAYHMPERGTPEFYAMGIIDQLLLQGQDSRLAQVLIREKGYTGSLDGGINALLGNQFNYEGPMLWMVSLFHDASVPADDILAVVDTEVERLKNEAVSLEELELARTKLRSDLYSEIESEFGIGKVDLLACYALFDDDPGHINTLEADFASVTPEDIQATAKKYLRAEGQTVLTVEPGAKASTEEGGQQ